MRGVVLVLALFVLGACGRHPEGNAQGGVVTWILGNDAQMAAAAQGHCNQFGKAARMGTLPNLSGTAFYGLKYSPPEFTTPTINLPPPFERFDSRAVTRAANSGWVLTPVPTAVPPSATSPSSRCA